jgi:hypothetical protein
VDVASTVTLSGEVTVKELICAKAVVSWPEQPASINVELRKNMK